MTNVFEVVGEHREEPTRRLMRGDDGLYYAFGATDHHLTTVEPSDEWELDREEDDAT